MHLCTEITTPLHAAMWLSTLVIWSSKNSERYVTSTIQIPNAFLTSFSRTSWLIFEQANPMIQRNLIAYKGMYCFHFYSACFMMPPLMRFLNISFCYCSCCRHTHAGWILRRCCKWWSLSGAEAKRSGLIMACQIVTRDVHFVAAIVIFILSIPLM